MGEEAHNCLVPDAAYSVKLVQDLQGFAQLQCLTLEITHFSRVGEPKPDLAALQCIPHVRMCLYDYQHLLLTAGSWQSLEIVSPLGFNIAFSDCRQFVTGAQEFLFVGFATIPVDTIVAIMKACQEYGTHCCELRCQDVRRREIMNPESVSLSTNRQAAQAYKCKVIDAWDMGLKAGFTYISLVDQSKLWPSACSASSPIDSLELGLM